MSSERPILLVDDDAALRATLTEQLSGEGEFWSSRPPISPRQNQDCPPPMRGSTASSSMSVCLMATAAICAPAFAAKGSRFRSSC